MINLQRLWATKSFEALRQEAQANVGLKRSLGALDLVTLGIGAIMGTGIFVITGQAAALHAGPAVVVSFVIAGMAAALAALCYSEMASMIPVAGSAYTYAYAALGELCAFVIGWNLVLSYAVSAALVSVGWSGYFVALLDHAFGLKLPWQLCNSPLAYNTARHSFEATGALINVPAIVITAALSILLVFGVRESARLNAIVVVIKLAVVLIFVGVAGCYIDPNNWQPFVPKNTGVFGEFGYSGIFQAATMVFVSYIGFDAVSVAAQESKKPQRDVPIGILVSLTVCTALYVAVAAVLTGVVSYTKLSVPYPIAVGIEVTQIHWLSTLVDIGALSGLSSVILVMLLAQPRIAMAMARDGLLPGIVARIHPRYGTPYLTTLGSGFLVAVAGGLLSVDILGELVSVGTLFAFALVSFGVMVLRRRKPQLTRPFKVPGGPYLVPGLSVGVCVSLMYTATLQGVLMLLAWLALGLAYYAGVVFRRPEAP